MANALFDSARESFLGGSISWTGDTIKFLFCDEADDIPVPATDNFLDDILAAARVAISGALASKTKTAGVADAADNTVTAVSGDQFESIVFFKDTTVEATSDLIAYFNVVTGLPFTPSGADILVIFDNGANKIFKL